MSNNQDAAVGTAKWLEDIKNDAARMTEKRLSEDGVDLHRAREAEINGMEGVAPSTPVTEAALKNPSDPGLANFQTISSHTGPKNVHSPTNDEPTELSRQSAEQANKRGSNTTSK